MRIVYFRKSDGIIGDVCSSTAYEKAFTKKENGEDVFDLDKVKEGTLSAKFGDDADQYDIAVVPQGEEPVMGGVWDVENSTMSVPPPARELNEDDTRLNEILDKWEADPSQATTEEVVEYLLKAGLARKIG